MGELFEKEGFSDSDGDIENLLDPLDGWRLPTRAEWQAILEGPRDGATVNGTSGVRWAYIQLSNMEIAGTNTPYGLLLFPDGKTITGKTLSGTMAESSNYDAMIQAIISRNPYLTTGITVSELNEYLEQGCAFFPAVSAVSDDNWTNSDNVGIYLSSSFDVFGSSPSRLSFSDTVVSTSYSQAVNVSSSVRLVKSIE